MYKALSDQLKIRNKELKTLKSIAQMILDQRSDIEEFFLESLEYVKEEIKKTQKQAKFPEISSKINHAVHETSKTRAFGDKVDFSSLGWPEKEKILRVLFSKINAGGAPSYWRNSDKLDNMVHGNMNTTNSRDDQD